MGQILHGSAATTHAVRAAIQRSKVSVAELAAQYHLNPKTVRNQRARLQALERGNKQLRQANGILRKASAYFAQAELDRRSGK